MVKRRGVVSGTPLPKVRGVFLVSNDPKRGPIPRVWPGRRIGNGSPEQRQSQEDFAAAVRGIKQAIPEDVEIAYDITKGSTYLPRDYLMSLMYGTQLVIYMSDGTVYAGRRTVPFDLQNALDLIGSTPGMLLYRATDQWRAIAPPDATKYLRWNADISALEYAVVENPNIQTLLDAIGTVEGAMLFRSSGGWVILDPAADGSIMLMDAGVPSWGALTPASGGAVDLFAPPAAADFTTIINGGSQTPAPTVTDGAYGMVMNGGKSNYVSNYAKGAFKAANNPSNIILTAQVRVLQHPSAGSNGGGIFIRDTTGKMEGLVFRNGDTLTHMRWADASSPTAVTNWNDYEVAASPYLRLSRDGTNFDFAWSKDGRNFFTFKREAYNAYLGTAAEVGVLVDSRSGDSDSFTGAGAPYITTTYWHEA